MENELSVAQYIGIAFIVIIIVIAIMLIIINIEEIGEYIEIIFAKNNLKNTKITNENYKNIYDTINNSTDISLQEKANFNKNYIMFGKKIIGYKVKDVLKEVNI